jgi:hypothetical protein
MFEVHQTIEGVLMKGLIEIEQSSSRMNKINLKQLNN